VIELIVTYWVIGASTGALATSAAALLAVCGFMAVRKSGPLPAAYLIFSGVN
jgi:hypothetical protein